MIATVLMYVIIAAFALPGAVGLVSVFAVASKGKTNPAPVFWASIFLLFLAFLVAWIWGV